MKRIIFSVIAIIILSGVLFYILKGLEKNNITNKSLSNTKPSITPTPKQIPIKTSIFVPYWTAATQENQPIYMTPSIPSLPTIPSSLIYFGVQPGSKGLDKTDVGYKHINESMNVLTLRMLDTDQNLDILEDKARQEALIKDTIALAKTYNIKELLLDFEVSAIPFTSLQKQITDFITLFSNTTRANHLKPSLALYGDHFFRVRPFDLPVLNPLIDTFYIMSYDLHKSKGNPGPNFPLEGKDIYGTDMKTSIPQFLKIIPPQKIAVVFGMYGYDWIVDEHKKPITTARALPLTDIKKDFIDECTWKNCIVKRDDKSSETEVNYIDKSLNYHIVWFEDEQSVAKKIEYLKTVDITNYSFWVWGYY